MNFFEESIASGIERGMSYGFTRAFWRRHKALTEAAFEVLEKGILFGGADKHKGARQALIEAGLIEKRWFGLKRTITCEGASALDRERSMK